MTARKSNPMVRGSSDADKVGKAYRKAMELLPQLSEAEYKEEGLIEEAVHPVLDTLDDASRMRGLDPKVKASAAAVFQRLLHAVEMYDRLPSEGGHLASMREEYLEPHMRIGQTRRSNPSPLEHMDLARHYLMASQDNEDDPWKAYDFTVMALTEATNADEYDVPGAKLMLNQLQGRRIALKDALRGGGKVSNPSPEEHFESAKHYLSVSREREGAGDLLKAYDFTLYAMSQAYDAADAPTRFPPRPSPDGADELVSQLIRRREALLAKLGIGGKVSNPRHGGAHYFVVLDKKGKQQFYTQTAAEARELLASNAKVRGGSYKHL